MKPRVQSSSSNRLTGPVQAKILSEIGRVRIYDSIICACCAVVYSTAAMHARGASQRSKTNVMKKANPIRYPATDQSRAAAAVMNATRAGMRLSVEHASWTRRTIGASAPKFRSSSLARSSCAAFSLLRSTACMHGALVVFHHAAQQQARRHNVEAAPAAQAAQKSNKYLRSPVWQ
jgi:hypothetical protein